VHGLVRSKEKAARVAAHEILPVVGDLAEPSSWAATARASTVLINCAVEYSEHQWTLHKKTVETLLECATGPRRPRKVIATSGVWVYGDTKEGMVDESSALAPPEAVGPRPAVDDTIVKASGGHLKTILIRPGCVYGGAGSLTASWFESAAKGGAARIVGDGTNRWAMVHVHDLADFYVRAAESPHGGEVFNATDRSRFTVLECARAASAAAGAGGKVETIPVAEARKRMGLVADCLVLDQNVDSSKAARLLGWQPRHGGFVDGVARYHASWRAANASPR
jgi:nucleoside-diphosphate-sugar epimerase